MMISPPSYLDIVALRPIRYKTVTIWPKNPLDFVTLQPQSEHSDLWVGTRKYELFSAAWVPADSAEHGTQMALI
jgi:hypothetical protein